MEYFNIAQLNTKRPVCLPVKRKFSQAESQESKKITGRNMAYPVYFTVPYGIGKGYEKTGIEILPTGEKLHKYRLSNGQKIGIIKGSGCPVVQTRVDVGSLDEDEKKRGISHLIEHSSYHSSKKYNDIYNLINSIGGTSNADTDKTSTQYYISLDDNNLDKIKKAIEIMADMIFNPKFSNFENEKEIVISELQKNNMEELGKLLSVVLKKIFGFDLNAPDVIGGNQETIRNLTLKDIFEFHDKYYTPQNTSTVVISEYEPDELIGFISETMQNASRGKNNTKKPDKPLSLPMGAKRVDLISTQNTFGINGIALPIINVANDIELTKVKAMLYVLESRMSLVSVTDKLHDKDYVVFFLSIANNQDENETFRLFSETLEDLSKNPPNDFELECVKNKLLDEIDDNYAQTLQKASNAISLLQDNSINPVEIKKFIKTLTAKDIFDAFKYFNSHNSTLFVLHPKGTKKEEIDEKYQKSKIYTKPFKIPKTVSLIDVSKSLIPINVKPISDFSIQTVTLPNNAQLNMINGKTDKCHINWDLKCPIEDSKDVAISYVLKNMIADLDIYHLYKQQQLNLQVDKEVFPNKFHFTASVPYENIEEAIKAIKNNMDRKFLSKEFEEAKKDALNEVRGLVESSSDAQRREHLGELYNLNSHDIEKMIEALTIEDVKRYYNKVMLNSSSTVYVLAPFVEHPELINKIASCINTPGFMFKNNIHRDIHRPKSSSKAYTRINDNKQPEFRKIYNHKISGNPSDSVKFELLNSILSKRLFNDLREKQGLGYVVQSNIENWHNEGELTLSISSGQCDEKSIKKIYDAFNKHVFDLVSKPPSNEELEAAKSSLKIKMLTLFDNPETMYSELSELDNISPGICALGFYDKILDQITSKDIQQAAKYIFSTPPDYAIDADKETIANNINYFNSLAKTS